MEATFAEKLAIGVNDIINPDQVTLQFNKLDKIFLREKKAIKIMTIKVTKLRFPYCSVDVVSDVCDDTFYLHSGLRAVIIINVIWFIVLQKAYIDKREQSIVELVHTGYPNLRSTIS